MLNNNLLISVILKYLLIYNNLFTISVISENVTITIPSLGTFIGKKISNGSNGFLGIKYATVKGRRFKVFYFCNIKFFCLNVDKIIIIFFLSLPKRLCGLIKRSMMRLTMANHAQIGEIIYLVNSEMN